MAFRIPMTLLAGLASTRLTLLILAWLLAAAAWSYLPGSHLTAALTPPLLLLALNLGAAIATHRSLRAQAPLLLFHLCLLALLLLVAASRLTYFHGLSELVEGQAFDQMVNRPQGGPLHPDGLAGANFVNRDFTVYFSSPERGGRTQNRVSWTDERGRPQEALLDDGDELKLAGYRIKIAGRFGYAPVFVWTPRNGQPMLGTVNLPPYPDEELNQASDWTPPGSKQTIRAMLLIDEPAARAAEEFLLPARHHLVMGADGRTTEMQPGDTLQTAEGSLTYRELRRWIGYTVFYDWTIPWTLATACLAAAALGWHFWRKFSAAPLAGADTVQG